MRKVALLIGVERYIDERIDPLRFAAADAIAIGERLREFCGFDRTVVLTEQGGEERPDLFNIQRALEEISREINKDDLFFLFFSGHGIEKDGHAYLLTRNTHPLSPRDGSLSLSHLREVLDCLSARRRILMIDACRNDPFAGKGGAGNFMRDSLAQALITTANSRRSSGTRTAVLSACRPGQRAYEWSRVGHSLYTYFVLQGLEGAAWTKAGLEVKELHLFALDRVRNWVSQTPNHPTPQEPWYEESGSGEPLILAGNETAFRRPGIEKVHVGRVVGPIPNRIYTRDQLIAWMQTHKTKELIYDEVIRLYNEWAEKNNELVHGLKPSEFYALALDAQTIISDDDAWTRAATVDTEESYSLYIKGGGVKAHASKARQKLRDIQNTRKEQHHREESLWQRAQCVDTIQVYQHYLSNAPLRFHEKIAQERIMALRSQALQDEEEKRWCDVQKMDTIASYESYIASLSTACGTVQESNLVSQDISVLKAKLCAEAEARIRQIRIEANDAITQCAIFIDGGLFAHAANCLQTISRFEWLASERERLSDRLASVSAAFPGLLQDARSALEKHELSSAHTAIDAAIQLCPTAQESQQLNVRILEDRALADEWIKRAFAALSEAKFDESCEAANTALALWYNAPGLSGFDTKLSNAKNRYERLVAQAAQALEDANNNASYDASQEALRICRRGERALAISRKAKSYLDKQAQEACQKHERHKRRTRLLRCVCTIATVFLGGYYCGSQLITFCNRDVWPWFVERPRILETFAAVVWLSSAFCICVACMCRMRESFLHERLKWNINPSLAIRWQRRTAFWEHKNEKQRLIKYSIVGVFLIGIAVAGFYSYRWIHTNLVPQIQAELGCSTFIATAVYTITAASFLAAIVVLMEYTPYAYERLARFAVWLLGDAAIVSLLITGLIAWMWLSGAHGFGAAVCLALILLAALVLPVVLAVVVLFVTAFVRGIISEVL